MGYYQEVDEARMSAADFCYEGEAQQRRQVMDDTRDLLSRKYEAAKNAKVGDTFCCANCGKSLTKKSYQQKFCPPVGKKTKRYLCKDKYHNIMNPRGKFGDLY